MGRLADNVVSAPVLARYTARVDAFVSWQGSEWEVPVDHSDMDQTVMEYIEMLWSEVEPKSYASDLVAGLQHFRRLLRRQLNGGWRLLGARAKAELPARAPPLPKLVAIGLAGYVAALHRFDVGVLWLVGFHCVLRSGEMFNLRAQDVAFGPDRTTAVLSLGFTKTGKRQGAQESVTVSDAVVVRALWQLVQQRRPSEPLARLSSPGQRALFKQACRELGLEEHCFALYSIRRGGATHDFSYHGSLDRSIVRGRWSNSRTARLYITEGLAMLGEQRLSPASRDALATAATFWQPG